MGVGTEDETAFAFDGDWKEFAPVALTNTLLTLVTLGIYRFWGITRERQYLWRQTRFIDETLEWTGTGREIFTSFIVVAVIFFMLSFAVSFNPLLLFLFFPLYFWLIGVAKFRGIRYRLSRTRWHGIRGGSDDNGLGFGLTYMWKTIVGSIVPFMPPWMMTNLWNDRWRKMSFGPHLFGSDAQWNNIIGAYILSVFAPIFVFLPGSYIVGLAGSLLGADGGVIGTLIAVLLGIVFLASLLVFPVIYYSAFFREAINKLELASIEFEFDATTKDWVILYAGHVGIWTLAILPGVAVAAGLGLFAGWQPELIAVGAQSPAAIFGGIALLAIPLSFTMPFIRYRNWRFFITHLEARGEVNLSELTQSQTSDDSRGEGLLDALDVGAL